MKDIIWLDRTEYPFKFNYLSLPAGRMHYIDEGEGEVILFLHGSPVWSFIYRNLIKELSKEYRCIAPDYLGFGLSDKPAKWAYTPAAHAETIQIFIQELHLKDITLVVHDFGGPIGMQYGTQNPENIKRLIVLNSWMWPIKGEKAMKQAVQLFGSPLGKALYLYANFSARVLFPRAFFNAKALTPALHRQYLKPLDSPGHRMGTWRFAKDLISTSDWFGALWNRHTVLNQKAMLIIWGKHNNFTTNSFLYKWHIHFPQARIIKLESGHFVQEEKPGEVLIAIQEFLKTFA